MDQEELGLLRDLLSRERVLSLGVVVEGRPYVGMLPFAASTGYSSLLIHASSLARHSRGLADDAPFGALIHAADQKDADPQQLARLSLEGRVQVLDRATAAFEQARATYLDKFPASGRIFALPDFRLCALVVERGRLVAGFGLIRNVSAGTLGELAGLD